ncbi:ISAs1 family transposase [Aquimarina sp. RZ0]|uniref:ISAs1 family transposase n=1 Tax=Aquimarina sp. RZ0 TaxID=2607730 RepID=UPI00165FAC7E|nr:ISAs1 family transposase [Aquimarina sp. RZ0]
MISIDEDLGHGRVETRKCSIIDDLTFFDSDKEWKCLRTLIKIDSERFAKVDGKYQKETRYYISSLKTEASINKKIRAHWAVENNLHWVLDVNFNEDASRKRIGYAAANYNIIAKTALTLINKANAPKRTSKKNKRYPAALSSDFREKVLQV